ncbi:MULTISPECIES: ISAzo13-like element transposase-related protein [unclassified Microcoleus]|uniref:ISAzo13-like element transposase-related protein n=1 Tax=unclassified Microcoleus TaxID=2642155 RepID=UPI002FD13C1B
MVLDFTFFISITSLKKWYNKNRNSQCENIAMLHTQYRKAGNPIISFDTKKKEVLGNLYRPGTLYTTEPVITVLP